MTILGEMMKKILAVIAASVALLSGCAYNGHGYGVTSSSSPSVACGTERWSIKTGTDAGAKNIDLGTISPVTVHEMVSFPKPASLPPTTRIQPVETSYVRLTATLKEYKAEDDGDVHMVLTSGADHMIAEIPNQHCVATSVWRDQIDATREAFNTRFNPSTSWKFSGKTITITGIGFYDFIHGQTGVAANGIEVHPVLSLSVQG
jgi:hypothetical protein